jgi:hypothetical protein
MNEIDLILTDYLFFLIFVLFLVLVIGFGIKGIIWLIEKLGVIRL